MSGDQPAMRDVEEILADPKSRHFADLRDRSAYMHLTGAYPKHLRPRATRLLTLISTEGAPRASVSDVAGARIIQPAIAEQLELEAHPIVAQVRAYVANGYKIRVSQGPNERTTFARIWLFKGEDQRTIKSDGSMLEGWA
jgi:hypothetical protein